MDDFNLEAPPGFRGIHPDIPLRRYNRHLPHWRQPGATYSVTFRLADSIPHEKQLALKRWRDTWERETPKPRDESQWQTLVREITKRTDAWLDEGYGECVFNDPALAEYMSNAMRRFQDERYRTSCFVVMPNHVHLIIKPFAGHELEVLLRGIKGAVARFVNTYLRRQGQLWEEESHDRLVRDEEHLWKVVQYIGCNPARAHLPKSKWYRWIHPDWEKANWRFVDT